MKKNFIIGFAFWLVSYTLSSGQTTTTLPVPQEAQASLIESPLSIEAFVDFYYGFDFNRPFDKNRPYFLYSHNRHNEFALNNAILSAVYNKEKIRGTFGLITGTYASANYAAEPTLFQFIYQAFAGYQISKNLWLDAGIFSSHIGAESAVSMDNLTLTRSLMAENSPYYESGLKLTYEPNPKWLFSGLLLNGWQNIVENNDNKALGTQLQYKPKEGWLFNWSTFLGKESPAYHTLANPVSPINTWRVFNNFYSQFEVGKKVMVLTSFDIGFQQNTGGIGQDMWYTPNLILQYKLSDKVAFTGRAEYYSDKAGVIIPTDSDNGFRTWGYSLTFGYRPVEEVAFRLEGRTFHAKETIFSIKDGVSVTSVSPSLIGSLAIKF